MGYLAFILSDEQTKVIIDAKELDIVLEKAVSATRGCSILSLMDLYGQLSRVINNYSRTCERKMLPQVNRKNKIKIICIIKIVLLF